MSVLVGVCSCFIISLFLAAFASAENITINYDLLRQLPRFQEPDGTILLVLSDSKHQTPHELSDDELRYLFTHLSEQKALAKAVPRVAMDVPAVESKNMSLAPIPDMGVIGKLKGCGQTRLNPVPFPQSCHMTYKCSETQHVLSICAEGLFVGFRDDCVSQELTPDPLCQSYHPTELVLSTGAPDSSALPTTFPLLVESTAGTLMPAEGECTVTNSWIVHPQNCSVGLYCVKGENGKAYWINRDCGDLHFFPTLVTCVSPHLSGCKLQTSTSTSPSSRTVSEHVTTAGSTLSVKPGQDCAGSKFVVKRYPPSDSRYCTEWLECSHWTKSWELNKCPSGFGISHLEYNYVCSNTSTFGGRCGLQTPTTTKAPREGDECDNEEHLWKPNYADCSAGLYCVDGAYQSFPCFAPGGVFAPHLSTCLQWPEGNITCPVLEECKHESVPMTRPESVVAAPTQAVLSAVQKPLFNVNQWLEAEAAKLGQTLPAQNVAVPKVQGQATVEYPPSIFNNAAGPYGPYVGVPFPFDPRYAHGPPFFTPYDGLPYPRSPVVPGFPAAYMQRALQAAQIPEKLTPTVAKKAST